MDTAFPKCLGSPWFSPGLLMSPLEKLCLCTGFCNIMFSNSGHL